MSDYVKELNKAYERYEQEVIQLAREAREEHLVPFLKFRGWEFMTGNGTWNITDPSKFKYLPDGKRDWRSYAYDMTDDLPKWLDDIMRAEVEGSRGNGELALWMLDYCKEKTRNGGGTLA